MDLFDVSKMTDPLEIVKYVYNFLNKHSKTSARILINNVINLFSNNEFEWENNMCAPHSMSIMYVGNYMNFPSTRTDVDHEGVNAMTSIINKRFIDLRGPDPDFSHLIQPQKMSLEDCYFVEEILNCLKTRNCIGESPTLYIDKDMNGIICYNACRDSGLRLNTIMTQIQLPLIKQPYGYNVANQLRSIGFDFFDVVDVYDLKHGSYEPSANIRKAYVSDLGSKELNISMALYLYENEKINDEIHARILLLLNEFKMLTKHPDLFNESYIVYHGSTQEIHVTNTFATTSFLSTTRVIDVANDYGKTIYVITIPKRFPVINFQDNLYQILLPIGTVIKVDRKVNLDVFQLIYCHVTDDSVDMDPFISMFENRCVKENNVTITTLTDQIKDKTRHTMHTRHTRHTRHTKVKENQFMASFLHEANLVRIILNGSSVFFETQVGDTKYIIKDIIKASNTINVLHSDHQVFKRILNELLAAHIYSRVFKLATFDYTILDKRKDQPTLNSLSNYLIVSKSEKIRYNLTQAENDSIYKGFLVDCIMGNWDVYNNENVGIREEDGEPVRTDVGGALVFRGRGDEKINFVQGTIPDEHTIIASQPSFKALNIANEKYILALHYLRSIPLKSVQTRLSKIKKEFTRLIDTIHEKENAKKYHALVERVIQAVEFRYMWYRQFAKSIKGKQTGGSNANITISDIAQQNIQNIRNINITDAPMAFTTSPAELKRILLRHQACARK